MPLLSGVLAGGVLLALAVPALQLRMATPGPDTFPKSLQVVKTYNRMQQAFPGQALPATVVVKAPDVHAPAGRNAIDRLKVAALATGRARGPITVDENRDGTIANITVPIIGSGRTRGRLPRLRHCVRRSFPTPSVQSRMSGRASPG